MRIVVNDIAASTGGALTVLKEFYNCVAEHGRELAPEPIPVPRELDEAVARVKLATLGISIDTLTEQQKAYIGA